QGWVGEGDCQVSVAGVAEYWRAKDRRGWAFDCRVGRAIGCRRGWGVEVRAGLAAGGRVVVGVGGCPGPLGLADLIAADRQDRVRSEERRVGIAGIAERWRAEYRRSRTLDGRVGRTVDHRRGGAVEHRDGLAAEGR